MDIAIAIAIATMRAIPRQIDWQGMSTWITPKLLYWMENIAFTSEFVTEQTLFSSSVDMHYHMEV